MYSLIRYFSNKEYRDQFVAGKLYMNTLDYFWNNGFDDQKDLFEGVVCTVPVKEFGAFPTVFQSAQATDFRFRAEGYKYCNVCCFSRIDYVSSPAGSLGHLISYNYNPKMTEFGSYAVLIKNEDKFINRVRDAANSKGYKYLCGNVNYKKLMKDGRLTKEGPLTYWAAKDKYFTIQELENRGIKIKRRDCFDKSVNYEAQKEWRIALYRGIKDTKAYTLDIGDLSDIVTSFDASELTKVLEHNMNCGNPISEFEGWRGNTDRKEMRELFYKLGDNKTIMFATIG